MNADSLESFEERTRSKLRHLSCPSHKQSPRVVFHGTSLREVTVTIRSCCDRLSRLANQAIAAGCERDLVIKH